MRLNRRVTRNKPLAVGLGANTPATHVLGCKQKIPGSQTDVGNCASPNTPGAKRRNCRFWKALVWWGGTLGRNWEASGMGNRDPAGKVGVTA